MKNSEMSAGTNDDKSDAVDNTMSSHSSANTFVSGGDESFYEWLKEFEEEQKHYQRQTDFNEYVLQQWLKYPDGITITQVGRGYHVQLTTDAE